MRRIFAITWLASTACTAVWIIAFGFAGETPQWLSLNAWVAIVYGVVLAAIAMVIPAALLSAALWAVGIKKLKTQSEDSAMP
jgi:membrane-associated PAP2 superfamily phosphatase